MALKNSFNMSNSKQFIIKPETSKRKRSVNKQEPADGVMIIPQAASVVNKEMSHRRTANVKVIATLDIKATRTQILAAWQSYTPEKIVGIFRQAYPNIRTLSVMLSRFKSQLSKLENPPAERYLDGIKLKKQNTTPFANKPMTDAPRDQ